jgi:hypothetical protein
MSEPGTTFAQMPDQNNGGRQLNQWAEDFYIYSASFGNMAAGAVTQTNVQIQADSNFEWVETTCYGNMATATPPFNDQVLLPINITLVDSGSSRQLFSLPIPLTSFAGNGRQPFILPVSRIFQARANIQITAQNFDGANAYNNVFLNFIGRKLFKLS